MNKRLSIFILSSLLLLTLGVSQASAAPSSANACYTVNPAWADKFTPGQLTFIDSVSKQSKINSLFVAAWTFNELNGDAAIAREAAGSHNWLNIAYSDDGSGSTDQLWRDPNTAATTTVDFFRGRQLNPSKKLRKALRQIIQKHGRLPQSAAILGQSGWAVSQYRDGGGLPGSAIVRVANETLGGPPPGCKRK